MVQLGLDFRNLGRRCGLAGGWKVGSRRGGSNMNEPCRLGFKGLGFRA